MYGRVHIAVSFAIGLVVGVVGLMAWQRVQDVRLNEDPLDYVTIASRTDPIAGDPDAMLRRLDQVSDTGWRLRQLFIGIPQGERSLPEASTALGERLNYPEGEEWRLAAVLTDLLDDATVAEHGRLVVIWFQGSNNAHDWLLDDPRIFPDAEVEQARRTWWAGEFVVYYSPHGARTDHGAAIGRWADEVTRCATHANPCPAG